MKKAARFGANPLQQMVQRGAKRLVGATPCRSAAPDKFFESHLRRMSVRHDEAAVAGKCGVGNLEAESEEA